MDAKDKAIEEAANSLFARVASLPELDWSIPTPRMRLDPGFHSRDERAAAPAERRLIRRLPTPERAATPIPFRDLLLHIARQAHTDRIETRRSAQDTP
ncbi:MAG TPA: hypothetical protein VMI75_32210 [Polyangiaceae bacterium]|nr:hypothetical protein [Polyangiaceae bacterium]